MLIVKVFGQIDFGLWFVNHNLILVWTRDHVNLFLLVLLGVQRTFANADLNKTMIVTHVLYFNYRLPTSLTLNIVEEFCNSCSLNYSAIHCMWLMLFMSLWQVYQSLILLQIKVLHSDFLATLNIAKSVFNIYRDLMINHLVLIRERLNLQSLLIFPDHAQELPIGISWVNVLLSFLFLQNLGLFCATLFAILLQTFHFFNYIWATTICKISKVK